MVGRLLMLPNAWVTMGELSVRIVVPMAMKKLERYVSSCSRKFWYLRTQTSLLIRPCTVPVFAACRLAQGRSAQCW
jgi:hypothetical protein